MASPDFGLITGNGPSESAPGPGLSLSPDGLGTYEIPIPILLTPCLYPAG